MSRVPLLLPAALLVACTPVDPDIELQHFASCDEMSDYMAEMAKQEVLWDWRWNPGGFVVMADKGSVDEALESDSDAGGGGASSYSTTNIQELGVDESDLVKTDGEFMYSLAGRFMVVTRAWPVEEAEKVALVGIDGSASGIYLYGDLAVVESTVWGTPSPRSGVVPERGGNNARTLVTVIDISDPTHPEVLRETYAVGELVESRRIDERLFVVTYQDVSVGVEADDAREAERAVKDAEPGDWLPWLADNLSDGRDEWASDERTACACTDVWASEREGGTWLVSVLSMDLTDPHSSFEGSAVVGQAETVYASTNAIYVASTEYEEGPFPSIDDVLQTVLHKFDIAAEDEKPQYAASAKVLGTLESRFGLSEYHEVLRVATTEYQGDAPSAVVTTLREDDGQFVQLDSLDGIGEGEEIYATRFVGDLGYVVTYWQVDPLFTLDLSDPSDISVGGSLEMEGWSDYLHPMDATHLLAVGIDGDWQLQVSLFDVADIAAPALVDRVSLNAYGSESQYEPHAFNYFADEDALAIPAWSNDDQPGLEVLQAVPTGLSYTGRVEQTAVLAAFAEGDTWCAPIRRSVIMADEGVDALAYAVSGAGITVAPLAAPWVTAASVPFTGVDPCDTGDSYSYYEDW